MSGITKIQSDGRGPDSQSTIVAAIAYIGMIVCIWGAFATTSGMPYETAFPYMSQTSRGVDAFLYKADPLRIFTQVFYHVSYLLSEILGIRGSFTAYQIVYAALWWARAMLAFLIVRRLTRGSAFLAFIVGALTLVHAADGALQWIGQINQFGFIFWMLLAIYMLVVALQQEDHVRAFLYIVLAVIFQYMCLWSYESPVFIILVSPIVIAILDRPKLKSRALLLMTIWWVVPGIYAYLTYARYSSIGSQTYQATVLRQGWSPSAILSDLLFSTRYSLAFWSWDQSNSHIPEQQVATVAAGALLIFTVAGLIISGVFKSNGPRNIFSDRSQLATLLGAGVIFLILSFPAYLLLGSIRIAWRTQFLSGIGTAIVLGSAISLVASMLTNLRLRAIFIIVCAIPLVWFGSSTAMRRGGFHREVWRRHLHAMQEVLRAAPQIRSGTIVIFTDVPKVDDPFGDDYWFDMALRLAYPGIEVAGIYYYGGGIPNASDNLILEGGRWKWDQKHFGSLIDSAGIEQTLVLEYEADGVAKVLKSIPPFLCQQECNSLPYLPLTRIISKTPSPEAVRRYGPL